MGRFYNKHILIHGISAEKYYKTYIDPEASGKCYTCGSSTIFCGIGKGYPDFCSCACAQSNTKTKKKQRKAHLGKPREDLKGDKNPAKRPEVRLKISIKCMGNTRTLGRKATKKQRKAISKKVKQDWARDPIRKLEQSKRVINTRQNYKQGWHKSPKLGRKVYYRSSYELQALKILDASPSVTSYSYETITIPYMYNGKCKHYIPDFIVLTCSGKKNCILEVKPNHHLNSPINKAKFKAAKKFAKTLGMSFKVWSENRLFR